MPHPDTPQPARPGSQGSAPSASHYVPELPYPDELQALLEGKFIVEKFLGQGGMGAVYQGLQLPLKRPVAIKILQKKQAGAEEDEFAFEERFKREAYAMAALTHPNIVQVYDCGEAGENFLFISMELVEGGDLSDSLKAGGLGVESALKLIVQICDGLEAAHGRGIVHRDIKPANIFLTADGRAKVADFGLAKKFDVQSTLVTKTGLGMGTPDYAAPEQYDGVADLDHRADIYALGVMFYQMLTGYLPRGAYKPPSQRAAVDPRLDAVVQKAMEQDRTERYQSVAQLKADVQQIVATWMAGAPSHQNVAAPAAAAPPSATRPASSTRQGTQATRRAGPVHHQPQSQPSPRKGAGMGMVMMAMAALAAIVGAAIYLLKRPADAVIGDATQAGTHSNAGTRGIADSGAAQPGPARSGDGGATVSLDWLARGFSAKVGYYRPQSVKLTTEKPRSVLRIPDGISAGMYATLVMGPTEAEQKVIALLEESSTTNSRLWIDANGNGDLTDDPLPEWTRRVAVSNGVENVSWNGSAKVAARFGSQTRDLGLRLYRFDKDDPKKSGLRTTLFYYRDFGFAGKVTLAGKTYDAVLSDERSRGDFRASGDVRLSLDLNRDGRFDSRSEGFAANAPFNIGGVTYELAGLQQEGTSFQIVKSKATVAEKVVAEPIKVGTKATPFQEQTTSGESIRFPEDYKGKLVLLDFWATWCPPCIAELPNLTKVYQTFHAQGFEVLGVSLDSGPAAADLKAFTQSKGMTWPQISDGKTWDARLARLYGVSAIPMAILVDGTTGSIVAIGSELRGEGLARTVERILGNSDRVAAAPGPKTPTVSMPNTEPWIDLIAGADPARDSLMVPWTVENGTLRSPEEPKGPDSPHSHTVFTFPIVKPTANYDFRMRITREKPGFTLMAGIHRDGKDAQVCVDGGSGFRIFGMPRVRTDQSWFKPGETHEINVQVREDRVRAYFDGGMMLDHAGALPSALDTVFYRNVSGRPPFLAVGVCAGRLTVHLAEYRAVDVAAERRAALIAADPRVAQLDAACRARVEEADKKFASALAALNQSYLANGVARARSASQTQGNLAEVTAFDAEKERVEKEGSPPLEDAPETPVALKSLRATYRGARAKLEAERARMAEPVYGLYLTALEAHLAELKKSNSVEQAQHVEVFLRDIAREKDALAGAAGGASP